MICFSVDSEYPDKFKLNFMSKKYGKTSDQSIFSLYIVNKSKLHTSYKASNPVIRSVFLSLYFSIHFAEITKDLYYNPELYHLNIILKLFRSTETVFFPYCRNFFIGPFTCPKLCFIYNGYTM